MGSVCLSFEQVLALPEVLFYIFRLQCMFWMVTFLDQPSCTVWVEKVGLYLYHIGCSQLPVICGQRCGGLPSYGFGVPSLSTRFYLSPQ